MAHREEDQPQREMPESISVRLLDVEPFTGLTAAMARFCAALTPEVYTAMSSDATEALGTVQGILWRLEHSQPERE